MHAPVTVTPAQLPELLLHTAVVRPVFIWGQPGIGKSSLVEEFAAQVGLPCQTLLGTQLAAEDLIGLLDLQASIDIGPIAGGQTLSGLLAAGEIDTIYSPRTPDCFGKVG